MESAARRALSSAFSCWVDWHGLPVNPATLPKTRSTKKVRAERAREDEAKGPLPTWQEVWTMARAIPKVSDRLMMLLMAWCGPRLAEAASIEADWLNRDTREIELRAVWVKGSGQPWAAEPLKGGQSRTVSVPLGLWEALTDYLDRHWEPPRAGRVPVAFPPSVRSIRTGIGVYDRYLWRDCVWQPMQATTQFAFQTRSLRRYAASALVDAGATVLEAKRLLGHDKVETTERFYVRARAREDAHEARDRVRNTPVRHYGERLDLLYAEWVKAFGDPMAGATYEIPQRRGGNVPVPDGVSSPLTPSNRVPRDRRKKAGAAGTG